ncbi:hypothetical protein LNP05_08230 [Klebsiella pneumoniae subsp. pneumoniae]|nr:hypothetical protein [Klebsiella pneumoniae subsp. pneumoniae]
MGKEALLSLITFLKWVAPNEQMAILFKGMANIFGDLRAVAMLAEAEADAVEVIRNDPDLNEAAKKPPGQRCGK